jgi:glucokinase
MKKTKVYLGIDVGGTKMLAGLVRPSGEIVARKRAGTPRGPQATVQNTVKALLALVEELLRENHVEEGGLKAAGIAIPGIVDPDAGLIVSTTNMNLTGVRIVHRLEEKLDVPAALGNDANCGALGEKWLGAAKHARSAVGVFVGTGIGGGIICDGRLIRGARESAGEIGHMILQAGGPLCGCRSRGCLEALASRSAIERELRIAVRAGKKTALTKKLGRGLRVVKSSAIRWALDRKDPLVTQIVRNAAEALGLGCLSIRHMTDPEIIVLGGGLIEACGDFILPIVRRVVAEDPLPGARPGGKIVPSVLGDDAVLLGAVALAQELVGKSPLASGSVEYPRLHRTAFGEVTIASKTYRADMYIRADGKVKKRDKEAVKELYGTSHKIGPEELRKVCKGEPEILFVGTGQGGAARLTVEGQKFLRELNVKVRALPTPEILGEYNASPARKAALLHVTC